MKKLENKTIFITGRLLPTVKACAKAAAREGANVIVAEKRSAATDNAIDEIRQEGRNVVLVDCDITNFNQVQHAVETATSLFGCIDVALTNTWTEEKLESVSTAAENIRLDGNYPSGIYNCLGPQLEQMSKQKKGTIIKISAGLDRSGFAPAANAVLVKHGVAGLGKNSALEYAAEGIRINAICPARNQNPERLYQRRLMFSSPKPEEIHPGKPEDLASLFIFLASDQSRFVFGTTLEIGNLAQGLYQ